LGTTPRNAPRYGISLKKSSSLKPWHASSIGVRHTGKDLGTLVLAVDMEDVSMAAEVRVEAVPDPKRTGLESLELK